MIEIKHRWNGKALYTAESAQDVRAALEEAVKKGAYLQGAYLRDADLQGAYLRGADLRGDVSSPRHPLHAFRADYWSILDQAPGEVAGLREAIVNGRINGSVYNDGECGCLNGTIAILRDCDLEELRSQTGIVADGSRPAEQWFIDIRKGDKPLPLDTEGVALGVRVPPLLCAGLAGRMGRIADGHCGRRWVRTTESKEEL